MYNIHVYNNKNTKSQAPQYVKKCIAEIFAGVSLVGCCVVWAIR
jgi:hypothetical protein